MQQLLFYQLEFQQTPAPLFAPFAELLRTLAVFQQLHECLMMMMQY